MAQACSHVETHMLDSGWQLRQHSEDHQNEHPWLSVEKVPSEVHLELMRHGKIPDPFVDLNELSVRWVGEQTWQYRTHFATPSHMASCKSLDLVFEGLDTFATVKLNEQTILKSDNMFIEYRVPVQHLLKKRTSVQDGVNTLEIIFEPARKRGLEIVKAHPEHDFIVHQTEVSRGPVRKAQCHWGWDWGPVLLTWGPWKPIWLECCEVKFENLRIEYELIWETEERAAASHVVVSADILGAGRCIQVEVLFEGETVGRCTEFTARDNEKLASTTTHTTEALKVDDPQLWWPRGYGPQNLYEVRLQFLAINGTLVEKRQTIGFRKVELIQDKDEDGQSFYFRINKTDIFSGGSCWIPADSILTRLTPGRYREWISLLAEGNQVMIRIWGGGIYESDTFYEACDELGILVWQDFMFACASYPTYPDFLSSVETEARQVIRRLRNHPSLIIWCGNNEDYQLVERYNLEYRFHEDKDPNSWLRSNFPARYIYEHLLPNLVRGESGKNAAIYHPGSPWGNGTSTTLKVDPTVGDIHQWNVWHGDMRPYQCLPNMGGRFVSEFGMEAYPHLDTINQFITNLKERYPGSRTLDFHNKAIGHERRLLTYVGENFRLTGPASSDSLRTFAHLTQVMQADAMSWAYKSWRRNWGSAGKRKCGGVLAWQLNDCWPTISWAIVDYYLVKKPAYYAIARSLQPLAVGVTREFHDWTTRPADELWRRDTGHVDPKKAYRNVKVDVWVSSFKTWAVDAKIVVRFISIVSGRDIREPLKREVEVRPNGSTETIAGYHVDGLLESDEPEPFVIHTVLLVDNKQVSYDISWPEPIKYLDFTDRGVDVRDVGGSMIEVSAQKPVKGFVFAERRGMKLSDNGFDLVPGEEPRLVHVEFSDENLKADELDWTFVGQ